MRRGGHRLFWGVFLHGLLVIAAVGAAFAITFHLLGSELGAHRREGGHPLAALGLIVTVIALVSIPIARRIARPLERLTGAARRLADGDLSARSGIAGPGEVGVLATAFDHMAGELERRVRAEKELLADVSHEIRTPLARIRVVLELCAEEGADLADVRRHLEGLSGDVAELERLVDEVLAAARLDLTAGRDGAGALGQPAEPVAVALLADGAKERFPREHPGRALGVEVEDGLPAVAGSKALLRRAVDNLLDNAAKYSAEGQAIELAAARTAGGVAIEVRDRGAGVAPEDLPRLFEPFFRGQQRLARGAGGSGLGLALVRRIAQAHGGTVTAEPREGGGMIFRLVLPA